MQEKHFNDDHYPCHQSECQARKFVVFGSALDLQAHMVDEHGSTMSARDIKDARRVTTGFDFEEVPGAGGRRRGQRDGNRAREPPPQQQQVDPAARGLPSHQYHHMYASVAAEYNQSNTHFVQEEYDGKGMLPPEVVVGGPPQAPGMMPAYPNGW